MAQATVRLCVSTASSFEQRVGLCVSKQSALLCASPVDTRMYASYSYTVTSRWVLMPRLLSAFLFPETRDIT